MVTKRTTTKPKSKIARGDTVRVLSGKDKGKKGAVTAVLREDNRVIVEGVNMIKKHVRARRAGEKGQRVSVAAPLHISNVQLICPSCKKAARVGISREGGQRERVCRKCQTNIPVAAKK